MRGQSERGAAAVEFALVALLLITLLVGIMEFGRIWAIQGSLAQASRDAARTAAITESADAGRDKLEDVFWPLGPIGPGLAGQTPTQSGTPGQPDCLWSVQPSYTTSSLTGFFGTSWTISAKGAMRCNG